MWEADFHFLYMWERNSSDGFLYNQICQQEVHLVDKYVFFPYICEKVDLKEIWKIFQEASQALKL